jgi:hypothetical protein
MRNSIRDTLVGYSMDNDRLWLLHLPNGPTYAIVEYNDELTGYSPELAKLDSKIFHYGGNAYHIVNRYAPEHGWRVEKFEDRF